MPPACAVVHGPLSADPPAPDHAPEPAQSAAAPAQRTGVHILVALQALCIYVPRLAMPLLVPFLTEEFGFSEAAAASCLGAFFPA